METDSDPIVVEQVYSVPIAVVWKAITDKDQMRQWFFETMTDFKPEVGFETEFNVRVEDRDFPHLWNVTEVVPETRISYGWRYGGIPGNSKVTWELSETPDGTKVIFTHEGTETFSQDDPLFTRESGVAAWDYFLGESLKGFLDGEVERGSY